MFTGLIQHLGQIESIDENPAGRRLAVNVRGWTHDPDPGDSIAINGVCLTVVEIDGERLAFDVVHETLERTTIGDLTSGSGVNLEHAARAETLMGGHQVQGHVDCLATIAAITHEGESIRMAFRLDDPSGEKIRAVVPKGSIAIDGISLTIAGVDPTAKSFEVALIPETLARTTLGGAKTGDRVNIETDIIARTIAYQLANYFDGGRQ
jgi:riboflavin synthase